MQINKYESEMINQLWLPIPYHCGSVSIIETMALELSSGAYDQVYNSTPEKLDKYYEGYIEKKEKLKVCCVEKTKQMIQYTRACGMCMMIDKLLT